MVKAKSISGNKGGRGCLILFGGIFLVVGIGLMIGLMLWPMTRMIMAQGWEPTPCTILSSSVGSHSSSDGTTYSVDIRYEYDYNGRRYTSDRYIFVGGASSGYDRKKHIVNQYPAGSEQTCYVNPSNPGDAVLSREFSRAYLIGLFGLPFAAVGFFIMFAGVRGENKKSLSASGKRRKKREPLQMTSGAIHLKPASSSTKNLFGVIFIAAFWNGIVSVFVFQMVNEDFPLFMTLFMIPFVLVGVGLIVGVFYTFLALFNPKPEPMLTPGAIALGGTAEVEWTIAGSTRKIGHFRIWVEGNESATYTVGTNTHTATHTFEKIPICETDQPADMVAGRVQFVIPEYTMHSFEADRNKILWTIHVHGDIPKWPDINQSYPMTVLPLPKR